MVQNFQYDLTIRKTKTAPNRTKSVFLERWADIMKRDASLKTGQYAYTTDGRVIQIIEIVENEETYKGFDLMEDGHPEVELDRTEIYGVAFGLRRAI